MTAGGPGIRRTGELGAIRRSLPGSATQDSTAISNALHVPFGYRCKLLDCEMSRSRDRNCRARQWALPDDGQRRR